MVERRGAEKTKFWYGINNLAELGWLKEVNADGVKWNLARTAVVNEILREEYSTLIELDCPILETAQRQTADFIAKIDAKIDKAREGVSIIQIVVPVFYAWDKEADTYAANITSYPLSALRNVERDFNEMINLGYGRTEPLKLAGCVVDTLLHFTEDKQHAVFDFMSKSEPDKPVSQKDIAKAKKDIESHLSDGFGEDTVRFELLFGKDVLTPMFDYNNLSVGHVFEPEKPSGVKHPKIR
jgi:hypothetical protein